MNVTVKNDADVCTLVITDRIDTLTAPELGRIFEENADSCEKMFFDLSGVDYISSAGLRVLVSAHRKMSDKGGLILNGLTPDVLGILKMTGFDKKLTIK